MQPWWPANTHTKLNAAATAVESHPGPGRAQSLTSVSNKILDCCWP